MPHSTIKIPDWCYEEDVCLIDIQNVKVTNEVLYIFKDDKGQKKFHREPYDNTYHYVLPKVNIEAAPMLFDIDKLQYIPHPDKMAYDKNIAKYESDLRTEVRHAIDYRFNRSKKEYPVQLNVLYADIEIYNYNQKGHADIKDTVRPINAISYKLKGMPTTVMICKLPEMDKKPYIVPENTNVEIYDSEKILLEEFARVVRESNPDIITGWNFLGFDIVTIFGRMRKNGLDFSLMSPLKMAFCDPNKYGQYYLYGTHIMDMMELYKEFTYSVEESYSLDFISQKVLKQGKVSYTGSLDELYDTDLTKFIEYSSIDTSLLEKLDNRLKHIDLKFELMKICSTTWKIAETTTGLIDPLCISYAKNMNLACRIGIQRHGLDGIHGAYVRQPIGGIYGYVIDLDFTSLYPCIIRSLNIGPNTYIAKIPADIAEKIIYFRDTLDMGFEMEMIINPIAESMSTRKTIKVGEFIQYMDKHKLILSSTGTVFKNHSTEISFFNKILEHLMNSRKEYKDQMSNANRNKNTEDYLRFKNIQLAYKILANSLYGVLANKGFRFFNPDMAETITLTGQELIKFSGYHAGKYLKTSSKQIDPNFNHDYENKVIDYVIYQDTDSIFLDLGSFLLDKGVLDLNGKLVKKVRA